LPATPLVTAVLPELSFVKSIDPLAARLGRVVG
jgi:hypothetical protein